jgi:hypothetical protein
MMIVVVMVMVMVMILLMEVVMVQLMLASAWSCKREGANYHVPRWLAAYPASTFPNTRDRQNNARCNAAPRPSITFSLIANTFSLMDEGACAFSSSSFSVT